VRSNNADARFPIPELLNISQIFWSAVIGLVDPPNRWSVVSDKPSLESDVKPFAKDDPLGNNVNKSLNSLENTGMSSAIVPPIIPIPSKKMIKSENYGRQKTSSPLRR
jgi:hypothetical protein